jgi:hypothetical protein
MKIANRFVLALGVVGMASAVSLPAMAGDSYANGSSTIVLMNGASQSVAAEIGLPGAAYFSGPVTVTPTLSTAGNLSTNVNALESLEVDPGAPDALSSLGGAATTFTAAAAEQLLTLDPADATDLPGVVSIIRAGAGVDGLE